MRQVALNAYVKERWTPEQQEVARKLVGIAADIHLLMLSAREKKAEELEQMFLRYRNIIDEAIEFTRHAR
jgi:hypothetical protein